MNEYTHFFGKKRTIFHGKAPARLDVMGGIADYSGSLVLQMPLNIHTNVYIAKREDLFIRIQSASDSCLYNASDLSVNLGKIVARKIWEKQTPPTWSLYVLGCIFVFLDDKKLPPFGLDIWISSNIPIGAGISSSAALEVAALQALYRFYGLSLEQEKLAFLAQKAENEVVGAACGIMDQIAVHLGQKNALLPIRCQPSEIQTLIPLSTDFSFFGFNTGVKHAVSGNAYTKVRTAAFMGLSIILQTEGVHRKSIEIYRKNRNITLPYDAYLSNITTAEFEQKYAHLLPKKMTGKDFQKSFGTTTDILSQINPEDTYDVLSCTKHPIYENERIHEFATLVQQKIVDKKRLGQLMLESHQGYLSCGLSCEEADSIVHKVVAQEGLYGARITGGGSGGTLCILGENIEAVKIIQERYQQQYGRVASIFHESTDGAYFLQIP